MTKLISTRASLLAAASGLVFGAVAHFTGPTPLSACGYVGTLYQESSGGYVCKCAPKNCNPCM